jgi:hypothetical protein
MKNPALFERRLKLLKAEVDLDFGGLLDALENGLKVVVVTERYPDSDFDPDFLRRIGGMAMLCRHYGAVVVFTDESRFGELNTKKNEKT